MDINSICCHREGEDALGKIPWLWLLSSVLASQLTSAKANTEIGLSTACAEFGQYRGEGS